MRYFRVFEHAPLVVKQYGFDGIPATVIIGMDGKAKSVALVGQYERQVRRVLNRDLSRVI